MADYGDGRRGLVRRGFIGTVVNGSVAMVNGFGILIVIALFVFIIALLDWLGRRKERQSRNRAA